MRWVLVVVMQCDWWILWPGKNGLALVFHVTKQAGEFSSDPNTKSNTLFYLYVNVSLSLSLSRYFQDGFFANMKDLNV